MAKKHKLTKKTDHLDGAGGKDLFLAPMFEVNGHEKATLSNKDVLNGRGGIDKITAFIAADKLTPQLMNIEKAVFTRSDDDDLTLNLAKSAKLNNVQLKNFDSEVEITHAGRLGALTIKGMESHTVSVSGIKTAKVENGKFVFNNAVDTTLDVQTVNNGVFKTLTATLKDSSAIMTGDIAAETLTLHSNGSSNQISLDPTATNIKQIVIDGAADLQLGTFVSEFLGAVDASKMSGGLTASLGGANLKSVTSGAGNDILVLSELGGAVGDKAIVDLGAGDDSVDLTTLDENADQLAVEGGEGKDTAIVNGNFGDVAGMLSNFERLKFANAAGAYDMNGSGIETVEFLSGDTGNSAVTFNYDATATGGLKSVDGSLLLADMTVDVGGVELATVKTGAGNDTVTITALGGTEAGKALVDLGAGDDMLDVTAVALDAATQFFDGGAGIDTVNIKGGSTSGLPFLANFENIYIDEAEGAYDLSGSGIEVVTVISEAMAGAKVEINYDMPEQGGLQFLDASAMTKGMKATIGGGSLTTVSTGKGDDDVTLTGLAAMATVNLGDGNDWLDVADIVGDLSQHSFDGGMGTDVARVSGDQANWLSALINFENLAILNAAGAYDLTGTGYTNVQLQSSGVDLVEFHYDAPVTGGLEVFGAAGAASGLLGWMGGDNLNSVGATFFNDEVTITKLGGTTSAKAMVKLFDGDDKLDLTFISVDGTKQHFDGGEGHDSVSVYGKATKFADALASFESLNIVAAEGTYDVTGIGFENIVIQSDNLMNNWVEIIDETQDSALQSINASVLTSDVRIEVGGANLTFVTTGKGNGNDEVYLSALGGEVGAKGIVDTGAGDDFVQVQFALDGTKHQIDGGAGYDVTWVYGAQTDLDGALANFEFLELVYATGNYNLSGSNWEQVYLYNPDADAVNFTYSAAATGGLSNFDSKSLAGNLTAVIGSDKLDDIQTGAGDDTINITKLGGTAGAKAQIILGAGADVLDVTGIALDANIQQFDGGADADMVKISGAVTSFAGLLQNFEILDVTAAKGNYDLSGSGVSNVKLTSTLGSNVTFQFGAGVTNTLTNADASSLGGSVNWTVNSNSLVKLEGSQGTDILKLGALGGTTSALANINMGTGTDTLDVTAIALDSTRHRLEGGSGIDTVHVTGSLANISTLLTGFEKIEIDAATGIYNFKDTGITDITLNNALVGLTLNDIADGSKVTFNGSAAFAIALNVVNAAANSQDDLTINLGTAASTVGKLLGSGVSMAGLTTLNLESSGGNHVFNLGAIGGPTLSSVINISGNSKLSLNATGADDKIIKTINITNTAGVDMTSFDAIPGAFASSGAFITGGSGSDILVGGNGNDTINAGAGLNTIYGSLGADKLILQTGATNKDTLIYDNVAESNGVGPDTVTGFDILSDRFDFQLMNNIQNFNYIEEFATFDLGKNQLSTLETRAFFALDEHRLYVDVDHNGVIDSTNDFSIVLEGVTDLFDHNFIV